MNEQMYITAKIKGSIGASRNCWFYDPTQRLTSKKFVEKIKDARLKLDTRPGLITRSDLIENEIKKSRSYYDINHADQFAKQRTNDLECALMNLNDWDLKKARREISRVREEALELMEMGRMIEAQNILETEFGLEPDYLFDLIG